jgi:hypothetical protein
VRKQIRLSRDIEQFYKGLSLNRDIHERERRTITNRSGKFSTVNHRKVKGMSAETDCSEIFVSHGGLEISQPYIKGPAESERRIECRDCIAGQVEQDDERGRK